MSTRPAIARCLVAASLLSGAGTAEAEPGPAAPAAAGAPAFEAVSAVLCRDFGLSPADCRASSFADPLPIDVNRDGTREWIYVSTSGSDELCYVRHPCFAVVMARGRSYAVILSSAGGAVGFFGAREHRGYRDLVVTGANSAFEYQATLYVWSGRRYARSRSATCSFAPEASAPGADLCAPLADEVVLE